MISEADTIDRQPTIYVTEADHHRLSMLVGAASEAPPGAALLRQELDRALVVREGELPESFARLGSIVTYEDLRSRRVRTVRLVLPEDADIDDGRVSVFSPIGAALLGLTTGPTLSLRSDDGALRVIRIVALGERHDG
jgi:regulator of nucleoside diphosphate kinase